MPRDSIKHRDYMRQFREKTPEYTVWQNMKARCLSRTRKDWANYGGRGITVCQAWAVSFEAFLEDVGRRPSPKHQLDRIDNSKGYCKENCRWATKSEQMRNKRDTVNIAWRGRTQCLEVWSQELGIQRDLLLWRVRHWPLDKAMTQPVRDYAT